MKKLTTLLVALFIAVTMFAACGQSEEPATTEKTPPQSTTAVTSDKSQQKDTTVDSEPAKSEDATKVPAATDDKPAETTKPVEETKPTQTEQKNDQTATTEEKPPFFMDNFDGQFVKCKLPEKWTGQEDLNQGVAAAIINQTQKAGLSIQIVRDNKDSLDSRVTATSKSVNGTIDDFSAGKYNYKRVTFDQQGKKVYCMICIVGKNAYYVVTDILDDPGISTILESLELK